MMTAKQQLMVADLIARLRVHGALIEQQARELRKKDLALLDARVITFCVIVLEGIALYWWLTAPAMRLAGLECHG